MTGFRLIASAHVSGTDLAKGQGTFDITFEGKPAGKLHLEGHFK